MSGSVKFYALVTRNIYAVKRHINTIPKEDLCIIINTQNSDFETRAAAWCVEEGIEHYITVSDGTAATGKNTVFEKFLESDNDYMVLVDGDDYITNHGVWTYKQVAAMDTPPDVLAIEYQLGVHYAAGYNPIICHDIPIITAETEMDPETIHTQATRCFKFDKMWWDDACAGRLVEVTANDPDDFAANLAVVHKSWANHCYKYINNWETHSRLVWFSKAAINTGLRFDPAHVVGEDTVLYFELKHEHAQGNIVMKHIFDRYPTYVYDTRIGGIVEMQKDEGGFERGWLAWLSVLVDKYNELEAAGKMHEERIPELKIHTYTPPEETFNADDWDIVWPEGYKPDCNKLVNFPGKRIIKF